MVIVDTCVFMVHFQVRMTLEYSDPGLRLGGELTMVSRYSGSPHPLY